MAKKVKEYFTSLKENKNRNILISSGGYNNTTQDVCKDEGMIRIVRPKSDSEAITKTASQSQTLKRNIMESHPAAHFNGKAEVY